MTSSWYYADSENKPVGPLTAEAIHQKRAQGLISFDTYLIDDPGTPGKAWRLYRDCFPEHVLPPTPAVSPEKMAADTAAADKSFFPENTANPQIGVAQFRTLPRGTGLPTAAVDPKIEPANDTFSTSPNFPVYSSPALSEAAIPPETNSCALFGFLLTLTSLFTLPFCGIGVLLAPFSFIVSCIGVMQLRSPSTRTTGMALAMTGTVLSAIVLMFGLGLTIYFASSFQFHQAPASRVYGM